MPPQQNPNQPNTPPPNPPSGNMYPGQVPPPDKQPQKPATDPDRKKKLLAFIPVVLTGLLLVAGITFMVLSRSEPEQLAEELTNAADFSTYDAAYDEWRQAGVKDFEPYEKEKTLESLNTLASNFSFKQNIEADMVDRLIALGIAKMHAENNINTQTARLRLYVLLQDKLASVPNGITDENANLPEVDEARSIYEKFQNKQLTDKVNQAIEKRGLEETAAQRLKLGDTPLQEYELFALNFNSQSKQEEQFRDELGYSGWIPSLWTQSYEDTHFVGFSKSFAQSFVNKKDPTTDAYFLHEFSHTQLPLKRGSSALLLEERRAEEVSGNKGAYYDVKQFFIYLQIFTDYNVLASIQQGPTEAERIYTELYATFGVELADSIVASFPVAYLDGTTPVKQINEVQNMNEALKLAKRYGEVNDPDAQLVRIKERAQRLTEIFGSKQAAINDLKSNVAEDYQMPFVADIMEQTLENRQ